MESKEPIVILVKDEFSLSNTEYEGENRTIIPCPFKNSEELLSHEPRGGYSTGRTVGRNSLLEFDFHVNRMTTSFNSIFTEHTFNNQRMQSILFPSLQLGVQTYLSRFPQIQNELKLTFFITKSVANNDKDKVTLFTHVVELPSFPRSVNVEVRRAERHNPNIKDTDWVKQRKALELQKAKDVNEVVMLTEDGFITEGTQTNFFVLDNGGTIITASDDQILPGTIRNIVLDICKDKNIPLSLNTPNVKDISNWNAVFLTSSSRLILPIQSLRFPEEDPPIEHSFSTPESVKHLQELLWKNLQKRSTKLF